MSLAEVEELRLLLPSTTSHQGEGGQALGKIIGISLIDASRLMDLLKSRDCVLASWRAVLSSSNINKWYQIAKRIL